MPQAPQLAASLPMSTQRPPQPVRPDGQTQTPALQCVPPVHARLQAPQWALDVCKLVQVVLQSACPLRHAQLPATHARSPGQLLPHEPQWAADVLTSTHAWLHIINPPQLSEQVPREQTSPAPHAAPQVPQLRESDVVSTHIPLQAV